MNRKILFDRLRAKPFPGYLTQSQVDGTNFILDAWERHYRARVSIVQLGTCLGHTFHETGGTMQPIHEYGDSAYFTRMYDIAGSRPDVARTLGNVNPGDGAKFPGMGFIQSTGRANARRNTQKLRALGIIGPDVDFEQNPELMMRPEYAVHIMFLGMEEGWFTGVKLDDTVDDVIDGDEFADFVASRRIVNGKDRAEKIAGHSINFLEALVAAEQSQAVEVLDPIRLPSQQQTPQTQGFSRQQIMAALLTMLRQALDDGELRKMLSPVLVQVLDELKPAAAPVEPKAPEPAGTPTSVKASAWVFAAGAVLQILGIAPPPEVIAPILGAVKPPTTLGTLTTVVPILTGIIGKFGGFSPIASAVSKLGGLFFERYVAGKAAKK